MAKTVVFKCFGTENQSFTLIKQENNFLSRNDLLKLHLDMM